ncbi:MAG TPA: hypothetical protein DCG28_04665 [Lachnospiraceae bacterium]|nr:hypothetical protein [Lachnospiraceae bacterium]
MKTDIVELNKENDFLNEAIEQTEKAAKYGELDSKQTIRLRLLTEELLNMLPEMLEYCKGEFWVENEKKEYTLCVNVTLDDILDADRDMLMSVSTSGKNAAAVGIMGKIRAVTEMMLVDYINAQAENPYNFYSMGMEPDMYNYVNAWTLEQYRRSAQEKEENHAVWDELEKSIIANLADDVIVGIIGKKVDIKVKKSF